LNISIAKITESMQKINNLYGELNELAQRQDEKFDMLDNNLEDAFESAKSANNQLRKSKPKNIVNIRLVVAAMILACVVFFFISHYFLGPITSTTNLG